MEKYYNFFYRITNNINGKVYYGVHSTDNLNDGYMGSGKALKAAIKKHGVENFTKEILEFFATRKEALAREAELITMEEVNNPMYYNLKEGGEGGKVRIRTDEERKEIRKKHTIKWVDNNREHFHKICQKYYNNTRGERLEHNRKYCQIHKEERAEYHRKYYEANKETIKEKKREYNREYYQRKKQKKLNTTI